MTKHVVVGMSGGVDSSVTALLLLEQGYRVSGLFMKNWEEDDGTDQCTSVQDLADARQVCDRLGIALKTVNFAAEYWDRVFEVFLAEYRAGRTPNPDILCNKYIKFKAFLDHALDDLGADYIATGHYARVAERDGEFLLLKGLDQTKEQSYFLYALGQRPLSRTLFPIGHLAKSDVRALAKKAGFANHGKKDSTGICFIGERKFTGFLQRYLPASPGEIRADNGRLLGRHQGLMYYTVGQRGGLGIGGVRDASEQPWYVLDKDLAHNRLIVGQGHNHPLLLKTSLAASSPDWCGGRAPAAPLTCAAKIRYRQEDQPCRLTPAEGGGVRVTFARPQRAVTPGQAVVFYDGEICLGGGIIEAERQPERQKSPAMAG